MKKRLAAATQRQKLCFVKSISPDGCLIALPIERAMPLRHGPEEPVKKKRPMPKLVSMKPCYSRFGDECRAAFWL